MVAFQVISLVVSGSVLGTFRTERNGAYSYSQCGSFAFATDGGLPEQQRRDSLSRKKRSSQMLIGSNRPCLSYKLTLTASDPTSL